MSVTTALEKGQVVASRFTRGDAHDHALLASQFTRSTVPPFLPLAINDLRRQLQGVPRIQQRGEIT